MTEIKKLKSEIQKLKLRYEHRGAPYYGVIQQFFDKQI